VTLLASYGTRPLHDSLTGLPNRPSSLTRREDARSWSGVTRGDRRSFHRRRQLQDINDTLGHRVGDELLVELARRLTLALRETDTVGRLGGDEFVVLTESLPMVGGSGESGQPGEGP